MCNCDPIIPLNEEAKRLSNLLKGLFFGSIALLIGLIVTGDNNSIFNYIISMLVVLGAAFQANYQLAGIAIFFCFLNGFGAIVFLSLRIQNRCLGIEVLDENGSGMYIAAIILQSLSVIYHSILIYYLFAAYKEFKAIMKGVVSNPNNGNAGNNYGGYRQLTTEEPRERERFPGRGTVLGGN